MHAEGLPAPVRRALTFGSRRALVDAAGESTYAELAARAAAVAGALRGGRADLAEARVALLTRPGADYVAGQWGTWMAGGLSVPLSPRQAAPEWEYMLEDSGATHAVVSPGVAPGFERLAASKRIRVMSADLELRGDAGERAGECVGREASRALMLYTSGTTSRPKGVVLTHTNIQAQVECLTAAWEWSPDDRALHVLPLNHTHGVINILACALWAGATCEFAPRFDAVDAWRRLASGDISVFMAVPTIYSRMIAAWREAPGDLQGAWSRGAARLRLAVSGSAALPAAVFEAWRAMTSLALVERYGMTEIGMALSNPLHGERRPGFVGTPLPGVDVRLVNEAGSDVGAGVPGELLIRGPGVFREYWARPEANAAAFDGGWFRTGDLAAIEDGAFRILGRMSVDIIKTGGERVSALEIEGVLRDHPSIADCAVVGLPDADLGECVAAAITVRGEADLTLAGLREWARSRLSAPKRPRRLLVVTDLPHNAMGKVAKSQLIQLFEA
jgi:malonyl-CoA/methylmalonyl-CoA synthetase